ncbi:hypothetical protein BDR26DRAFT_915363 [Obelidium mucronatum]|nr:hypothetical protein BDR26DRAFT_915363 [Obelidium mucronatum]
MSQFTTDDLFLTPSLTSLQLASETPLVKEEKGTKKRGRKAVNAEPATKRIAQVRSAARAYRERKEKYVADLEATLKQLQSGGVEALNQRVAELEAENSLLKQMAFTFTAPPITQQQPVTPPTTDVFSWSNGAGDQTLTEALFSDALFQPLPTPDTPFTITTGDTSFLSTHKDFDLDQFMNLDPDLEALLKAPLPDVSSTTFDHDIVRAVLAKARNTMLAIPSLVNEQPLVDELFEYFTNFILFKTNAEPQFCRVNFCNIQVFQGKVLNKCIASFEDMGKAMKLFEALKKEFNVHLDDVLSNDPELRKIEHKDIMHIPRHHSGSSIGSTSASPPSSVPDYCSYSSLESVSSKVIKKKGRKPTDSAPANKKIALQREAAKKFRERKERYVTELEETVKSLRAEAAESAELRRQLDELRKENEALRQLNQQWAGVAGQPGQTVVGLETLDAGLRDDVRDEVAQLAQLPGEPPGARALIEPHFAGAKELLLATLPAEARLVGELVECYIVENQEYVTYCTKTVVVEYCKWRHGVIAAKQMLLLAACMNAGIDTTRLKQEFEHIRLEYIEK